MIRASHAASPDGVLSAYRDNAAVVKGPEIRRFFAEPEVLQRIKLSDTVEAERFWASWAAFAETAEQLCKDV